MAHNVTFHVPERPVGFADIHFIVRKDGRRFGTLRISKGALVWMPASKQKGYRLNWNQFDDAMQKAKRRRHRPKF